MLILYKAYFNSDNPSLDTTIEEGLEKEVPIYYTIESYEKIGRGLLISILDIFEKNPHSRIQWTRYGSVQNVRSEIASNLQRTKNFDTTEYPRTRCPSLCGVATKTFYKEILKENAPKKALEPVNIEKRAVAVTHIAYKPTRSLEPYTKKPIRMNETSVQSKIEEFLTEMTTMRIKTSERQTETEPPKLVPLLPL